MEERCWLEITNWLSFCRNLWVSTVRFRFFTPAVDVKSMIILFSMPCTKRKKTRSRRVSYDFHLSAQAYAVIAVVSVQVTLRYYSAITLAAAGPLAPFSIENSTFWPSSNVL